MLHTCKALTETWFIFLVLRIPEIVRTLMLKNSVVVLRIWSHIRYLPVDGFVYNSRCTSLLFFPFYNTLYAPDIDFTSLNFQYLEV